MTLSKWEMPAFLVLISHVIGGVLKTSWAFDAGVQHIVPKQRDFRFQPLDCRMLHNKLVFITSKEISCARVKRNSGGGERRTESRI